MKKLLFILVIITIITIPQAAVSEVYIPDWIRDVALWWGQGQISDEDFVNGIQYLIDTGILEVNYVEDVVGSSAFDENSSYDEYDEYSDYYDELTNQAEEIAYYRMFTLYDYINDEVWKVWFTIPGLDYFQYRDDETWHVPALAEDETTMDYHSYSMGTWQDVEFIADELREISGNDDELFANLVMQMVHQFKYEPTLYTKTPVEVFVEGSGDCDTLAVFAATIMYAGGLDVAVLNAYVPSSPESEVLDGAHALVGVAIEADDWTENWYIDLENGKRYYLAEATWPEEGLFYDPWEYIDGGYGTIGDNPWGENIEILSGTLPPA